MVMLAFLNDAAEKKHVCLFRHRQLVVVVTPPFMVAGLFARRYGKPFRPPMRVSTRLIKTVVAALFAVIAPIGGMRPLQAINLLACVAVASVAL